MDWLTTFAAAVESAGWAVTSPVVPPGERAALGAALAELPVGEARGGVRNLLDWPAVAALARSRAVRAAAEAVLGAGCFAVRGLLFDKRPGANWLVPWHQDVAVAVRERREAEGFSAWSVKAGVDHVHAPAAVLGRMLAVRVHLDECGADNGPLRLVPGSHRAGVLAAGDLRAWVERGGVQVGTAEAGAILAFRPLLLHASSAAAAPASRRVVHLEFAAGDLPAGLAWRWRV